MNFLQILDQIQKRAATRFQDPRGQDVYLIDYPEDYEKRVLSMGGFSNVFDKQNEFPWEKRGLIGFQGTRGKKLILDTWENLDKPSLIDLHVSTCFVCNITKRNYTEIYVNYKLHYITLRTNSLNAKN